MSGPKTATLDRDAALQRIWDIVHTPTNATNHRSAERHFMADFDAIRQIIKDTRVSIASPRPSADRNWAEDAPHENGNYECSCAECGHSFIGHKRRVLCKLCSNLLTPSVTSTEGK